MSFQARLRAAIDASGLSQKALCEMTSVSPAGLNNYLRGKYSPDLEVGLRLAQALGVTLAHLVGEDPNPSGSATREIVPRIRPLGISLLGRSPDDLSQDVAATPKQVRDWQTGKAQPTHSQLVLLFNELTKAVAAVKALEAPSTRPDALPAASELVAAQA